MGKQIDDYLVKDGNSLIAKDSFRIVIEKTTLDTGVATEVDSTIQTIGVFKIESLDGKDVFQTKLPMVIALNVIKRETNGEFIYLYYEKNNIVVDSMTFLKNAKAAISFLNLVTTGKIDSLSAADLTTLFKQNIRMNGSNTRVPSELVEAMVSELVRWRDDVSVPFRLKYGKVPADDFVLINIKDVARVSSVFGAVSFEDVKKALQSAVYMTRTKQEQTISPVESIL